MKGEERYLLNLLEGTKTRFIIPVYQRNYDWKIEQCRQLFDDLEDVAAGGAESHFFGSIVSKADGDIRVVIDGQQRITTSYLLLLALVKRLRDGVIATNDEALADMINEEYLIDKWHKDDRKLKLKLIKDDQAAFEAIYSGIEEKFIQESNVTQNYLYFCERIAGTSLDADELKSAIEKLMVIDIKLDKDDDAQRIFESLNSTGLELSEGDKIRNFVLMNLSQEEQEDYYEKYWNAVEINTDYEVSDYIRFYLAAMEGKTPAIKKVYSVFRAYAGKYFGVAGGSALDIDTERLLQEVLRYSKHYQTCNKPNTGVRSIDSALAAIHLFDATVTMPYLLNLLEYRAQGKIDDDSVASVLWVIDSYLFRRWVCNVPANALNKVFQTLHSDVLRGLDGEVEYLEVVKYLLIHKGGTGRFPDDEEFLYALDTRDFYHIHNRKFYLYDRLENGTSKERVEVVKGLEDGNFSVEHVMPQTLSVEWKKSLGEDWERIHEEWLHRMANLTVTAYNSDYSNRSFKQKLEIENGFKSSGFRMNQWIGAQETWGEEQLNERQKMFEDQFLSMWPYPNSVYVPKKVIPEEAELDSDAEFTNRRIAAFNFMGVRYAAKQWNEMEIKVLQLLYELEPAKMHSLVDGDKYPASAFCSHEDWNNSKIVDGVYARTSSSTASKIDLLKAVFEVCDVDADELTFEMPLPSEEE